MVALDYRLFCQNNQDSISNLKFYLLLSKKVCNFADIKTHA